VSFEKLKQFCQFQVNLPQKAKFEYKYLLTKDLYDMQWENGPNRCLSIDQNITGTVEVRDVWQVLLNVHTHTHSPTFSKSAKCCTVLHASVCFDY
jgi:hypothetical protein